MKKNVVYTSVMMSALIALATGCTGQYSKAENDYLGSENGKTIVVPAPLSKENINNHYVLPRQDKNPQVSIAPPRTRNLMT